MVPDVDLDGDSSPSKSDISDPDDVHILTIKTAKLPHKQNVTITTISSNSSVAEDDELGDGLRTGPPSLTLHQTQQQSPEQNPSTALIPSHSILTNSNSQLARTSSLPWIPGQVERRRRKLPEIPKNKKCKSHNVCLVFSIGSDKDVWIKIDPEPSVLCKKKWV